MPNPHRFGTQKVVRGLSRVSSVSIVSPPQPANTTSDLHSLSTALFGSTPPSDDDDVPSFTSSPSSTTSISPPPAYTTIYPSNSAQNEKISFRSFEESTSLLSTIFPATSPIHGLPATNISLDDLVPSFKGAVLNDHTQGTRTLYVGGGDYDKLDLRETICGILERAEEELGCTGVVLALEKSTPDLGELLHSLMYVGGVITTGPYTSNSNYLLVGLDL